MAQPQTVYHDKAKNVRAEYLDGALHLYRHEDILQINRYPAVLGNGGRGGSFGHDAKLREAFRILESESLIAVRRGAHGGALVRVPNTDVAARYTAFVLEHRGSTLADLYEARIVIEPAAVWLLAAKRTDDDLTQLRQALEEHDALVGQPNRSIRIHTAFHALLIELTGNQTRTCWRE